MGTLPTGAWSPPAQNGPGASASLCKDCLTISWGQKLGGGMKRLLREVWNYSQLAFWEEEGLELLQGDWWGGEGWACLRVGGGRWECCVGDHSWMGNKGGGQEKAFELEQLGRSTEQQAGQAKPGPILGSGRPALHTSSKTLPSSLSTGCFPTPPSKRDPRHMRE